MSLKAMIMSALSKENMTGYEITKGFSSAWGFVWQASHQQVYRELAKLSKQNSVNCKVLEQSSKPDKKCYTLTEQGKEELIKWLELPCKEKKPNDELMIKFFAAEVIEPNILINEVASFKQKCSVRLAMFKEIEKNVFSKIKSSDSFYAHCTYLSLRRGILALEASLAWCVEVSNRLHKFTETKEQI